MVVDDAQSIGAMARELAVYLQALGEEQIYSLTPERVRQDGFGSEPAFGGIIAMREKWACGYLLHHPAYDSDRAERYLVVCDLYVREEARRHGVGRALMAAAMADCRRLGGCGLFWSVYRPNKTALAFYRSLGANPIDMLDFMWWPAALGA